MPRPARHALLAVVVLATLLGAGARAATVTLVIDDLGYNRERARRALALPPPVTAAVLPDAPHAAEIARAAGRAGIELMLHLPMQGNGGEAMHEGFLHAGLSPLQLRQQVRRGLARVPGAIGVNNHMGSVLTTDRGAMDLLMRELRAAPTPLLFLDSRTSAESVAFNAATRAGVAATRRDVFLDNDRDPRAIQHQFNRWLHKARNTGCALAIAHPHPETLAVLERMLRHTNGVRRVGIAEYVRVCGRPANPKPPRFASRAEDPPARRQR